MTGEAINILIVGAGSIGRRHATNLLSISNITNIRLSVAEPRKVCRQQVESLGPVKVYPDIEDALGADHFDAAIVCTPNHLHYSQILRLAGDTDYVFVEKPLVRDVLEAHRLQKEIELDATRVMVGCNLRFHVGLGVVKSALETGEIGRPLYVRSLFAHYLPNWRPGQDYRETYSAKAVEGGGILVDAIHEPDYLIWLFGRVEKVSGELARLGTLEIDVEDMASYSLWHQSGVRSQVHVDYLRQDKVRSCEICGTGGTLVWTSSGKNPERLHVRCFSAKDAQWRTLLLKESYEQNQQYLNEMRYFIECVRSGEIPMNGVDEAVHVQEALLAVRRSADSGTVTALSCN